MRVALPPMRATKDDATLPLIARKPCVRMQGVRMAAPPVHEMHGDTIHSARLQLTIHALARMQDMRMALPPVHEMEDNAGGVLRLRDGTTLPPYLAMPRGLPLTEWYALHRPRQSATLAMLAQVPLLLPPSAFCHSRAKPFRVPVLLYLERSSRFLERAHHAARLIDMLQTTVIC